MEMNLSEIYTELIAEHNSNKENKRDIIEFDVEELGHNPSCGDEITLKIKYEEGKIKDIAYQGSGCAISQASTSMLIDLVKGKTKKEVEEITDLFLKMIKKEIDDEEVLKEILDEAFVFKNISNMPSRVKCAVLSWHTLRNAIKEKNSEIE